MRSWASFLQNELIHYLSLDEAIAIHTRLIEKFGGPNGIRDLGLLESALYRPQTGYYDDLLHMSAALFESLLMNHAFVDGNKRAAFFMTDIFLRINGIKFVVQPTNAHDFIVNQLEEKKVSLQTIHTWIKKNAAHLK